MEETNWYDRIFHDNRHGMAVIDGSGSILAANQACCEMLGYTLEELRRVAGISEIIPGRWHPVLTRILDSPDTGPGGCHPACEMEFLPKGGGVVPVEVQAYTVRRLDGTVDFHWAAIRDITLLKRTESTLRERNDFNESLIRSIPIPVYFKDRGGRYIGFNSAFEDFFGVDRQRHLGATAADISSRENAEALESQDRLVFRTGGNHQFEFQALHRDGSLRNLIIDKALFTDGEGEPAGLIGTILDVTNLKSSERKLLESQKLLRRLATEITLAEERARRRIATSLHDGACQGLVTAIMELQALKVALPAELRARPAHIAANLGEIVQELRDLTFDLSPPSLYTFGLESALDELLDDTIRAREGFSCAFKHPGDPLALPVDLRVLLYQSVRELIFNTIKHAGADHVKLKIARERGRIEITYGDNGCGFDLDRLAAPPTREGGFGLFNVIERLGAIGGDIRIDSAPGRGSTFTLIAPYEPDDA